MMKFYLLCKQKKNFPKEEEEQMASELLLATIVRAVFTPSQSSVAAKGVVRSVEFWDSLRGFW